MLPTSITRHGSVAKHKAATLSRNNHMAVEINLVYEGQLHCVATHGPSGATLATDAPVDNHGKGEAFSPTDLVAAAL